LSRARLKTLQSEILAQSPTLRCVWEQSCAAASGDPMAVPSPQVDAPASAWAGRLAFPRSLQAPARLPFVGRDL
jgi:hypothetical protein